MGGYKLLGVLFLAIIVVLPLTTAESSTTELNILNSAPEFNGVIPNFSWEGGVLLDAFNMNDYFIDLQGDSMNFSSSGEINIVINITEGGNVSFYPLVNYVGTEIITFYAQDEIGNASSNQVYLGVGVDLIPPVWSNPVTSKETIYQNDYILFNTSWKDNFELKNYYTSINQGSGWQDYQGIFSGSENISSNKIQISSSFGESIFWKVCAYDTANNMNCTDEYEIVVLKKPISEGGPESDSPSGEDARDSSPDGVFSDNLKYLSDKVKDIIGTQKKKDFSSSIESFLVTLKQGTSKTQIFEITNTGTEELEFNLSVDGLSELAVLSHSSFSLKRGESKVITIDFRVGLETAPGQYFGNLIVKSSKYLSIPLALNVNHVDLDFEVFIDVTNDSESVRPGNDVFANIIINNLGEDILTDVNFYYAIKDFNGEIYESHEESFSLGQTISFVKNLSVSKSMPIGKYAFYARVSNSKDVAINSDSFIVGEAFRFEAFIRSSFVFIVIISLSIFLIILLSRRKRQKEKERALNLYVRLNELKEYVKEGKFDRAASSYIAIKSFYGERVSEDIVNNKEKFADEIKKLANKINFEEEDIPEEKEELEEDSESKNKELEVEKDNTEDKLEDEKDEESKEEVVLEKKEKERSKEEVNKKEIDNKEGEDK